MSKVIVDQIQKNGGTTFTLPTSDASATRKPLVSDGAGTLSFNSALSMPLADSDANKALITDGSGQIGYSAFPLPTSSGANGQVLTSDGTSAAWSAPAVYGYKHIVNFGTTPASAVNVMWTDMDSSLQFDNIASVRFNLFGVSANSNHYFNWRGLDASGSQITTGYHSWGSHGCYNGSNQYGSGSHNSNNGWFRLPNYTTQYTSTQTYAGGLTGEVVWNPRRHATNLQWGHEVSYHISYQQDTSYNNANVEQGGFNNYSTSDVAPSAEGGVRFYSSSGTFDKGHIVIEVATFS